jgi:hypothetical protein
MCRSCEEVMVEVERVMKGSRRMGGMHCGAYEARMRR